MTNQTQIHNSLTVHIYLEPKTKTTTELVANENRMSIPKHISEQINVFINLLTIYNCALSKHMSYLILFIFS